MARGTGVGVTGRVQRHAAELEAVFVDVHPRLTTWACRAAGDDEVGRDVAAEAFARLLARRTLPDDPVPFLYRVALNLVRDRWRHQQVVVRTAPLLLEDDLLEGPGDALALRDVVERLPEKLRDPIVLHYFADLPVAQVAAVLGSPVGTVTKRLSEGRATLRTQLEHA